MSTENKKPENPVAFPHGYGTDVYERAELGMSLRDYFAAKVMQSVMTNESLRSTLVYLCQDNDVDGNDFIAKQAYMMADSMLKARENVQ